MQLVLHTCRYSNLCLNDLVAGAQKRIARVENAAKMGLTGVSERGLTRFEERTTGQSGWGPDRGSEAIRVKHSNVVMTDHFGVIASESRRANGFRAWIWSIRSIDHRTETRLWKSIAQHRKTKHVDDDRRKLRPRARPA